MYVCAGAVPVHPLQAQQQWEQRMRSIGPPVDGHLTKVAPVCMQVLVPVHPPQTRQQWEQWNTQYWPTCWRAPDTKVQAAVERVVATEADQVRMSHT
jgi:hypothetical protein